MDVAGVSSLATTTIADKLTVQGASVLATTTLGASVYDAEGGRGTAGQLLSATVTGTQWITTGVLPATSGANTNTTAVWNGTAWVNNATIKSDGSTQATITTDLTVQGTTALATSTVANDLTVQGTSALATATIANNLTVQGTSALATATIANNLTVSGASTLATTTIQKDLDVAGVSSLATTTIADKLTVQGASVLATTTLGASVYDAEGGRGTAGQLLSATVTGTQWITTASLPATAGTNTNTTLYWDGTTWINNTALLSNGSSQSSITTDLSITATETTINAALTVVGTTTVNGIKISTGKGSIDTNTVVGNTNALSNNSTGGNNVALGYNAYNVGVGQGIVALGSLALENNISASANVAVGYRSSNKIVNGTNNVAVGTNALFNGDVTHTVAVGDKAMTTANDDADYNVALGSEALRVSRSANNIGIGYRTLYSATTGGGNIAIGVNSLPNLSTGASNTTIGHNTGSGVTTGSGNTILGANVSGLSGALSNSIILADGTGNQRLFINSDGKVGLGTSTPLAALDINSSVSGVLLPRISLTNTSTFISGSATSNDNSMLVYNTNTVTSTTGLTGTGFYYWDGGALGNWNKIGAGETVTGLTAATTHSTQRWDGNEWVENTALLSNGSSQSTITTNLSVTGTQTVLNSDLVVNGESSLTGTTTIAGITSITGDSISLTGTTTINGDAIALTGSTALTGTLAVSGNSTLTQDLIVAGNTTASGTLTTNSTVTLGSYLVDAEGSRGTAGQLLSATVTGTQWIAPPTPLHSIESFSGSGTPDVKSSVVLVTPASNTTISLDPVANYPTGFELNIKRTGGGASSLTIDPDGSETIDGATTVTLNNAYQGIRLLNTGSEWIVIN